MNINNIHNIYFLGIGGIGMSGLARYFKVLGKNVAGYDKTPSKITDGLREVGIAVYFEDELSKIPEAFKEVENTLVVYTPAVPKDNVQYQFFETSGIAIKKRAEVLGIITKDTFCYAVAGTHGKTTTSAILAHILKESGQDITAFLGGVSENFNSNFIIDGTDVSVVEADEFDRSFLSLSPDVACITSIDADHLDIYGEAAELERTFKEFTTKLKPGGKLIVRNGLSLQGLTYGIEDESDYCIRNIRIQNATYCFDMVTPKGEFFDVKFNKPGQHNLLNALAAFAMAVESGNPTSRLVEALSTFKGVERRFSYQIKSENLVYVDDYAHHPTEIEAVFQAVKEMYPNEETLVIFQPHLFSRTKDFADDFGRVLSKFSEVALLDIYPAREKPIDGVTSDWLLGKIANKNKKKITKEEIIGTVKASKAKVVLTLGAGDIGQEVANLKAALLV
ncbi:UDP-N-acetylmuramate--L-alanine ligase [Zhouia amylolytica]|uniref:UDP-N-acetylmuramate--L-alanine ligase n=1 Tax=Zhouia amylolytica AD3 TaxID=1286632 RepID=W2UNR6_9FLAO|nr:UDP-N-acetylmuramate--L-alanine ligase [Zhouia amylolytica]ETN94987.1 UDP-N-acetylmuramate--alanine ligase [Zhouia amylolytica AD3]